LCHSHLSLLELQDNGFKQEPETGSEVTRGIERERERERTSGYNGEYK